jgi:hypothetical protein
MTVVAALAAASVAFLHGGNLVVLDTATHAQRIVMHHAGNGPVRWSGDGKLVSSGGKIAGGPSLPAGYLRWAPAGERAAFTTKRGGVEIWSPRRGIERVAPDGFGAQSVAWTGATRLAIGRTVCRVPCRKQTKRGIWTWDGHHLRRTVDTSAIDGLPTPFGVDAHGNALWWAWPDSNSIAADGVGLYDKDRKLASMLMYSDWVAHCGKQIALAVGGDRNSMQGKSIELDGRDVSKDPSRSWNSPACSSEGKLLVATALPSFDGPWGSFKVHRSLWQLLPTRRRLTSPPRGWTDESPVVLPDRSILFVRTRQTSRKINDEWWEFDRGTLELLHGGLVTPLARIDFSANELNGAYLQYYGHYMWPDRVAVRP